MGLFHIVTHWSDMNTNRENSTSINCNVPNVIP